MPPPGGSWLGQGRAGVWRRPPRLGTRGCFPVRKLEGYLAMCGIAGWLGTLPNSENYGLRVAQVLRHRGPDGYGIRSWPEATLVHTRLSIIDLSSAGAQPMANEDGTVWTVFNGEIY